MMSDIRCNCARCCKSMRYGDASGESQVFSPTRAFELCEPCWLKEDAEIEANGSNKIPELLAMYIANSKPE